MTKPTQTLLEKLADRLYFLTTLCDYDYIKFWNGLLFMASAAVVFFQPGYLSSNPTLMQLLHWLPERGWVALMFLSGAAEWVLLAITGTPPLFSRGDHDVIHWRWAGGAGFWWCAILYMLLALLLTPPHYLVGWGNIWWGAGVIANLWGSIRAGVSISDEKQRRYKASQLGQAEAFLAELTAGAMKTI